MKRLPLIAFAACLAVATAHAQSPASAPQPAPSPEVAATADDGAAPATDAKAAPDTAEKARLSDANCVRQTGTRITPRDGKSRCNGQPGRAYTKDDIDRTGHTNLADALRTLDPAIR